VRTNRLTGIKRRSIVRRKWFVAILLLILAPFSQVWGEPQYLSEAKVKELTQMMIQLQWIDGVLRWNERIGGYHIVALDLAQGDKTIPIVILNQNDNVLRKLVGKKVHYEGLVDPKAVSVADPKFGPPEPMAYILLTGFATDYTQIPGKLPVKRQVTPYRGDRPPIKGPIVN
jgi:hypothetical protein